MGYDSAQDGDSFGSSLWIKGTECTGDESKWTLSGTPPPGGYRQDHPWEGLPGHDASKCQIPTRDEYCYILRSPSEEAVLRALAQDALQRAVKAFGRAQFKKKECSAEAISEQADYPIIQQELRKFCSTPD